MTRRRTGDLTSDAMRDMITNRIRILEKQLGVVQLPDLPVDGDISREMVETRIRVLREMVAVMSKAQGDMGSR